MTAASLGPLFSFDGAGVSSKADRTRLSRQLILVRDLMKDGVWRTLAEIAAATSEPEASVSARLRDLRKERFGSFLVDRRRRGPAEESGLFEYRVRRAE